MVERIKFNVTYKGKNYRRVADFAKAAGINTPLVLARIKNGWTDPERLALPPLDHREVLRHTAYPISYKGVKYSSLAEFSRAFKLSRVKVYECWHTGHKDPADIIQRAQPGNQKGATKDLLFQKSKDEEAKKEYLKELGLLSPTDVSKATGIPRWKISKTICNLIKNEHREPKSNISDIGIHREDIIILTENETTLTTISNSIVVPKYGIKPIAIPHIKTKQNYLKSLDLIQIPYFSHYYYDVKNKRILSLNKRTTMKEIRPRRPNSYKLRRSRHAYSVSTKDIDDWLKRPNIQYDDLLSYADLSDILGISRYWWENNGIRQSIMPILHKRYNFKTNKAKIGFDRDELIEALKKSEKTKGFVDKLIKK